MKIPKDLLYTKDHEWVRIEGNTATIGITEFAQNELGDIVFVEVDTVNQNVNQDEVFGTIEAVKTVSDLFMPLKGKVMEVNKTLNSKPEVVNQDPYSEGWIIKIEIHNKSEQDTLLTKTEYEALIGVE